MGIPIEKQFVINAARRDVWAFLTDPSRVAGCLPGASITGRVDERTHAGTIAVKVGPVSARYKGTVRFERLDEEAGVAEIAAAGQDVRGKGGADLRMTSRVVARGPCGDGSNRVVDGEHQRASWRNSAGESIQDVSDEMFRRFTDAMRAALESASGQAGTDTPAGDEPASDSPTVDAVSLGATVGTRAFGRLVRRPGFWLAVVIAAAILWLIVD